MTSATVSRIPPLLSTDFMITYSCQRPPQYLASLSSFVIVKLPKNGQLKQLGSERYLSSSGIELPRESVVHPTMKTLIYHDFVTHIPSPFLRFHTADGINAFLKHAWHAYNCRSLLLGADITCRTLKHA